MLLLRINLPDVPNFYCFFFNHGHARTHAHRDTSSSSTPHRGFVHRWLDEYSNDTTCKWTRGAIEQRPSFHLNMTDKMATGPMKPPPATLVNRCCVYILGPSHFNVVSGGLRPVLWIHDGLPRQPHGTFFSRSVRMVSTC